LPIRWLLINGTGVTDLSPLRQSRLWRLSFSPAAGVKGLDTLRNIETLNAVDGDVWYPIGKDAFLTQVGAYGHVTNYFEQVVRLKHPMTGNNRAYLQRPLKDIFADSEAERIIVISHKGFSIPDISALVQSLPQQDVKLTIQPSTDNKREGHVYAVVLLQNGMTFFLEIEFGTCTLTSPGGSVHFPLSAISDEKPDSQVRHCVVSVVPSQEDQQMKSNTLIGKPVKTVLSASVIERIIFPRLSFDSPLSHIVAAIRQLPEREDTIQPWKEEINGQDFLDAVPEISSVVLLKNGDVVEVEFSRSQCFVTAGEGRGCFKIDLKIPPHLKQRVFGARMFPSMAEFLKATEKVRVGEPW